MRMRQLLVQAVHLFYSTQTEFPEQSSTAYTTLQKQGLYRKAAGDVAKSLLRRQGYDQV